MNKEELLNHLDALKDSSQLQFYVAGEKVSNRFDFNEYEMEDIDKDTLIAYTLYSLICDVIIFKAQGKERAKAGESIVKGYFNKVLNKVPQDIKEKTNQEVIKATLTLGNFLNSLEKVNLATIIARFSPLVALDIATRNTDDIDKKVLSSFDKNKERIFNKTLLYIRSLYHSFLTLNDTDSLSIKIDVDSPVNGLFIYKDALFISTGKNAFTVNNYKKVIKEGLERASKNFSLNNIKKVVVVYLVKDILAEYTF